MSTFLDLTDSSSFERAKFWVNELKQTEEVGEREREGDQVIAGVWHVVQECIVYLCGTKVDLVEENKKARKVDIHMVREYAEG